MLIERRISTTNVITVAYQSKGKYHKEPMSAVYLPHVDVETAFSSEWNIKI